LLKIVFSPLHRVSQTVHQPNLGSLGDRKKHDAEHGGPVIDVEVGETIGRNIEIQMEL
jgi:hypothetical protein